MSKERKVIKSKYLELNPWNAIYKTLVTVLALDLWNAPEWLWGVFGVFFLFIWIGVISLKSKEKEYDVFLYDKEDLKKSGQESNFHKKLFDMMQKYEEQQKVKQN